MVIERLISRNTISKMSSNMSKRLDKEHGDFNASAPAIAPTKSIAATYIESTTIHGLSPIYSAGNLYMRVFWLLLFTSAFGLMSWQISQLVGKVNRNDIVTNIKASFHKTLPYPAVTMCNANGFQKSKTRHMSGLIDTNLNESEIYQLGQSGEEFFLKGAYLCNIAGDTCIYPRDYTKFSTPDLGNCFTWKSNLTQKRLGSDSGLSLILNINVKEYGEIGASYYSPTGALVIVHPPEETLTHTGITNNAILLSPGTITDIKVKKQRIKRLPEPYPDKCFRQSFFSEMMGYKLKKSFKYSTQLCQMMCYFINRYNCGYVPIYLQPIVKRLFSKDERKFTFNETAPDPCKFEERHCECRPPCDEDAFQLTVSSAFWPQPDQATGLIAVVKSSPFAKVLASSWTNEDVYKNLVALQVYFSDFTVQTIEQKPAYGWSNFLSDLGGQMGLWIGASVYSGFEFCSLFLNLITYLLSNRKKSTLHPDMKS